MVRITKGLRADIILGFFGSLIGTAGPWAACATLESVLNAQPPLTATGRLMETPAFWAGLFFCLWTVVVIVRQIARHRRTAQ